MNIQVMKKYLFLVFTLGTLTCGSKEQDKNTRSENNPNKKEEKVMPSSQKDIPKIGKGVFALEIDKDFSPQKAFSKDAAGVFVLDNPLVSKWYLVFSVESIPSKGYFAYQIETDKGEKIFLEQDDFNFSTVSAKQRKGLPRWFPFLMEKNKNFSFFHDRHYTVKVLFKEDKNAPPIFLNEYHFKVPPALMKSVVRSVTLMKGDKTPTSVFETDDYVYAKIDGDFARGTSLAVFWGPGKDESQIKTFEKSYQNHTEAPGFFPKNLWSKGSHKVIIYLDKELVGEYKFEVK